MEEIRNTEIIILLNYAAAKISDMTARGCHRRQVSLLCDCSHGGQCECLPLLKKCWLFSTLHTLPRWLNWVNFFFEQHELGWLRSNNRQTPLYSRLSQKWAEVEHGWSWVKQIQTWLLKHAHLFGSYQVCCVHSDRDMDFISLHSTEFKPGI